MAIFWDGTATGSRGGESWSWAKRFDFGNVCLVSYRLKARQTASFGSPGDIYMAFQSDALKIQVHLCVFGGERRGLLGERRSFHSERYANHSDRCT